MTWNLVLALLVLVSSVIQTWMGWVQFTAEEQLHGQSAQWFGPLTARSAQDAVSIYVNSRTMERGVKFDREKFPTQS